VNNVEATARRASRQHHKRGAQTLGALLAMVVAFALLSVPALAAEGERVFDPNLSLIGGCNAEALDPVEDPGCPGGDHPSSTFAKPVAVATDLHGNIYVLNYGFQANGTEGRLDIFDSSGAFITEMVSAELRSPEASGQFGPLSLAIDSAGVLYVFVEKNGIRRQVLRYAPCDGYDPEAGEIEYCDPPAVAIENPSTFSGLAINRDNDHLFVNDGGTAKEYGSATEGNPLIRETLAAGGCCGVGMAVDAERDLLYVSAESGEVRRVDVFDLTSVVGAPPGEYEKVGSIEESALPEENIGSYLSIAVDEATGHVFVLDTENKHLFEFDENQAYVSTLDFKLQSEQGAEIGVDNGPTSPNQGYLYVPSHRVGIGHSFAFEESVIVAPQIKSLHAAGVDETEAELVAQVNPGNAATTYRIEYTTEASFLAEEFAGATVAGEGTLPIGNLDLEVSAIATGLQPGTAYRFRVLAENEKGDEEAEASFATYPSLAIEPAPCPNVLFRSGPSAPLPDCRAYELVTPPDTNGRAPLGVVRDQATFTTRQVSPGGGAVPFKVDGGSLPGFDGTGSFLGDPYVSTRTAGGWTTELIGPSGAETRQVIAGSTSPDQGYSFWTAQVSGSAVIEGKLTGYVRFPDGHSELLGQGSLGAIDPQAFGQLISEGGDHIIFSSGGNGPAVQLEPEAAPNGTDAIYDRVPNPATGERETKVVSLKPGDEPFAAGEKATYMGASLDGEGIAFKVGGSLYLRYRNAETFEVPGAGLTYAGLAEGGGRIFYLEGGDLKAFDASTEAVTEFTQSGDVTPVFVAQGGTAAYFLSPTVLIGEANPNGEDPQLGAKNLYLSQEGQLSFVGVVTERDVKGELISGIETVDGLGLWAIAANPAPGFPGRFGIVPARATPDGSVLLFKSRAQLTAYDPEGKAQLYRYDSAAGELQCLSCNPTGAAPSGDATLQSEYREGVPLFFSQAWPENLRADGDRAIFESSEPLVPGDSDGRRDVYQWEAGGVGSCTRPQGCVNLISSPGSLRDEYLWAVSQSGDDVFFLSADLLVEADADTTASIYDARVGGGFAEDSPPICEGEGCRPRLSPPPPLPAAATPVRGAGENFTPRRCAKGKRKVKRNGKVRCVKKKHGHRKQAKKHRAAAGEKGDPR
jgi:hypothetical protein